MAAYASVPDKKKITRKIKSSPSIIVLFFIMYPVANKT